MRAFLIDPFAQSITEVDYDGDYKSIYGLIKADLFTTLTFNEHADCIFLDDEGLLKPVEIQAFFALYKYPQPLAGRGLVLGTDLATGESIEPTITLKELTPLITFLDQLSEEEVSKWHRFTIIAC